MRHPRSNCAMCKKLGTLTAFMTSESKEEAMISIQKSISFSAIYFNIHYKVLFKQLVLSFLTRTIKGIYQIIRLPRKIIRIHYKGNHSSSRCSCQFNRYWRRRHGYSGNKIFFWTRVFPSCCCHSVKGFESVMCWWIGWLVHLIDDACKI